MCPVRARSATARREVKQMGALAEQPLLTVTQAAEALSVSKGTVYELVTRGDLPAVRVGGQIRFVPAVLDQWLKQQSTGSTQTQPRPRATGPSKEQNNDKRTNRLPTQLAMGRRRPHDHGNVRRDRRRTDRL